MYRILLFICISWTCIQSTPAPTPTVHRDSFILSTISEFLPKDLAKIVNEYDDEYSTVDADELFPKGIHPSVSERGRGSFKTRMKQVEQGTKIKMGKISDLPDESNVVIRVFIRRPACLNDSKEEEEGLVYMMQQDGQVLEQFPHRPEYASGLWAVYQLPRYSNLTQGDVESEYMIVLPLLPSSSSCEGQVYRVIVMYEWN